MLYGFRLLLVSFIVLHHLFSPSTHTHLIFSMISRLYPFLANPSIKALTANAIPLSPNPSLPIFCNNAPI